MLHDGAGGGRMVDATVGTAIARPAAPPGPTRGLFPPDTEDAGRRGGGDGVAWGRVGETALHYPTSFSDGKN